MGGLIIGMMTRTALGHTGRLLAAGRAETAMFVLVQLAAVLRVAPVLFEGLPWMAFVTAASVCWSAAFALYFATYAPKLIAPRVDGRPG